MKRPTSKTMPPRPLGVWLLTSYAAVFAGAIPIIVSLAAVRSGLNLTHFRCLCLHHCRHRHYLFCCRHMARQQHSPPHFCGSCHSSLPSHRHKQHQSSFNQQSATTNCTIPSYRPYSAWRYLSSCLHLVLQTARHHILLLKPKEQT